MVRKCNLGERPVKHPKETYLHSTRRIPAFKSVLISLTLERDSRVPTPYPPAPEAVEAAREHPTAAEAVAADAWQAEAAAAAEIKEATPRRLE